MRPGQLQTKKQKIFVTGFGAAFGVRIFGQASCGLAFVKITLALKTILAAEGALWLIVGMTSHAISPFTPLVLRLAQILGGLRTAVAACGGRRMLGWDRRPDDPRIVPLIVPIVGRLARLMQRFERLMAKLAAGWRPDLVARPAQERVRPEVARARADVIRLPRGFAWLVQLTHGATAYAGHLEALLAEPGPRLCRPRRRPGRTQRRRQPGRGGLKQET